MHSSVKSTLGSVSSSLAEKFATRNSLEQGISPEQLDQIIDAIVRGKYSWACVLMLRFVGYNPMHYIPYRTYCRLVKEHKQQDQQSTSATVVPFRKGQRVQDAD